MTRRLADLAIGLAVIAAAAIVGAVAAWLLVLLLAVTGS